MPSKISQVLIFDKAEKYLTARNLINQYKKAKRTLLLGDTKTVEFKLRKPKENKIYEFRINKKYRAFGFFNNSIFKVSKISDHQKS